MRPARGAFYMFLKGGEQNAYGIQYIKNVWRDERPVKKHHE